MRASWEFLITARGGNYETRTMWKLSKNTWLEDQRASTSTETMFNIADDDKFESFASNLRSLLHEQFRFYGGSNVNAFCAYSVARRFGGIFFFIYHPLLGSMWCGSTHEARREEIARNQRSSDNSTINEINLTQLFRLIVKRGRGLRWNWILRHKEALHNSIPHSTRWFMVIRVAGNFGEMKLIFKAAPRGERKATEKPFRRRRRGTNCRIMLNARPSHKL